MIVLNPKHLCSSMANTIVVNRSKKEIGRCVRQKRISYITDDLKQAKGDIFLTETFHKEFIKMKSNEISKRTEQILEKANTFFIEQGKKKDIDYFILFPELVEITNASM